MPCRMTRQRAQLLQILQEQQYRERVVDAYTYIKTEFVESFFLMSIGKLFNVDTEASKDFAQDTKDSNDAQVK